MSSNNTYIPGKCNIGEQEVRVRKKFLSFLLPLAIGLTYLSLHYCQSFLCWTGLLILSFLSIVLYLEIRLRFCILFGFFNLYNFGKLGELMEVTNDGDCKKDRNRVMKIIFQSLFASLAYAYLVHMFATNYDF